MPKCQNKYIRKTRYLHFLYLLDYYFVNVYSQTSIHYFLLFGLSLTGRSPWIETFCSNGSPLKTQRRAKDLLDCFGSFNCDWTKRRCSIKLPDQAEIEKFWNVGAKISFFLHNRKLNKSKYINHILYFVPHGTMKSVLL